MTTLTPDLEHLLDLVEKQKVKCPCLSDPIYGHLPLPHRVESCYCCTNICKGLGYIPDPVWAGVLNVLREECPCGLAFPIEGCCNRCLEHGRHDAFCLYCRGKGYRLRPVWQELADAGIEGALGGALGFAFGETTPSVTIQALIEELEEKP